MFFYIYLSFGFSNGLSASGFSDSKSADLESLFENQPPLSPVDLHNKALQKLKSEDKTSAVILFRKNFYQSLFFPSYLTLKTLKEEVSLAPFIWQIGSLLFALLSLICLVFSLKQAFLFKRNFKMIALWFCGLTIVFLSGFFNLKKRVSNLKELELLNSPFEKALSVETIRKGSDLVFLKQRGKWGQVKTSQHKKGWLLKENLIQTLE